MSTICWPSNETRQPRPPQAHSGRCRRRGCGCGCGPGRPRNRRHPGAACRPAPFLCRSRGRRTVGRSDRRERRPLRTRPVRPGSRRSRREAVARRRNEPAGPDGQGLEAGQPGCCDGDGGRSAEKNHHSRVVAFVPLGAGSACIVPTVMGLAGNQPGVSAGRGVATVSFGQWPAPDRTADHRRGRRPRRFECRPRHHRHRRSGHRCVGRPNQGTEPDPATTAFGGRGHPVSVLVILLARRTRGPSPWFGSTQLGEVLDPVLDSRRTRAPARHSRTPRHRVG